MSEYPQNPDLDGISAFTANGDGTVTATVSYTGTRAPEYITGDVNVYNIGGNFYIIGAETAANNGTWTIVSKTTSSITYSNASGVTQSNQFALCSPINVVMNKGLTSPLTITAATPFSYSFSSTSWNPPPNILAGAITHLSATYNGAFPILVATTGNTTRLITTFTSISVYIPPIPPFIPAMGTPPNVSAVTIRYEPHDLANLYPYNFSPSITLPIVNGTLLDDGSNFLTFDGQGTIYSKCNIFNTYRVSAPTGLALDTNNGVLYVVDTVQKVVRKIMAFTGVESIIAGGAVTGTGLKALDGFGTSSIINDPVGIAIDLTRNVLYVSEQYTGSVRKITLSTFEVTTERLGALDGSVFDTALGLAINSATNTLYFANLRESKIVSRNLTTHTDTTLLSGVSNLYALALDTTNNKLYYTTGTTVRVLDLSTLGTSLVWTGLIPYGLAVDSANGFLYATDTGDDRIYRITISTLAVTIVAGSGTPGSANGTGTSASFNQPWGIVVYPGYGLLYIADNANNTIRKIALFSGAVTTDVISTIPAGHNAITISGETYIYNSNPTITCIPGSDVASYTLRYNGSLGLRVNALGQTSDGRGIQLVVNYTGVTSTPSIQFTYLGPLPIQGAHPAADFPFVLDAGSSTELVPFIGPPSANVALSTVDGFTSIPSGTLTYALRLVSQFTGAIFETYTNTITVTPFPILSVPAAISPLTIYTYQPFSYLFSAPDYTVSTTLDAISYSSPALIPYITSPPDRSTLTFASSGLTAPLSAFLNMNASYVGRTDSIGSNYTTINVLPSQLIVTPSIVSGTVLNLYKFEAFSYVFSITGVGNTLTIRYTNSSSQLRVYSTLSADGKTFTFEGTPVASYASTFSLIVDLMNGTTVVSTTTFPVTIGAARIQLIPASPYALNQYENISNTFGSNITLTASNDPTTTISVPTLPSGLSFSNAYTIVGSPRVQQPLRNYQLIASNSSNGNIATANIAISVGIPVVRITPSSATFTNLNTTSTPTATFTALLPATIYGYTFQYLLPALPSGLFFTDISNVPKSGGSFFTPTDPSNTVKLAGTPDMTDAFGFPSSGIVNLQLAGYFRDATNVQIIGTASLSFRFAETVLLTTRVSSNLYVGKALGSNDVVITAASYFPSTSPIETFGYSGFLPDGLSLAGGPPWYLTGTPTTAGTTSNLVTAMNFNGISNTILLVTVINPNIVTFASTPSNQSYIVSRPLESNAFQLQASSTSGSVVTYSSSLDFSLYGLTFNTTTGALSGVPLSNLSTTPVTFTATDEFGAFATVSPSFEIRRDVFTWPPYTRTFFQNREITPFQIVVTTLSGRAIQSFSSTNMPPGLFLSSSGLITGTFEGSTNGDFTVTATTGYQPPSTSASQLYLYTAIADNLLIAQVNGIDSFTDTFSVDFTTIQYSSDGVVYPTYSVSNVYPLQYPAPVITMSPSGTLSGDFTEVLAPYPTYLADVVATYSGVTTATTAVISISNTPRPLLLAGVASPSSCNIAQLRTTSSYVFTATTSGARVTTNQTWGGALPIGQVFSSSRLYPDIGQIGTGFVAVTASNVFDGVYNSGTAGVNWTTNTPVPSPLTVDRFGSVATDGVSEWLLVQMSSPIVSFYRTGNTGPWTQSLPDLNTHNTNTNGDTALTYIEGNYVFGQASNGTCCNVLYYTPSVDRRRWFGSTSPPDFSNILRFATSNTTLVAVGSGAEEGIGALSYSTDYGVTWSMPSLPSWMQGPNVVLNDIAYDNSTWVTCGVDANGSNLIAYSADISNWQIYSNTGSDRWSAVAFNGNAWTIAGSRILTSPSSNQTLILSLDAGPWPTQATSLAINPISVAGATPSNAILFSKLITSVFSNTSSFPGTVFIPPGTLTFTQPSPPSFVLYQHVPYTIPIAAVGTAAFIYYYASGLPIGLQFILDPSGRTATISGRSSSNGLSYPLIYAKTGSSGAVAYRLSINTVLPYFTSPQLGAGAYTAIVREHVDADAAQNARDAIVYPRVNPLAGPFMAPRAPDVVTQTNCFLKLCKKPCPTCRSTM